MNVKNHARRYLQKAREYLDSGQTAKTKDHAKAAKGLRQALGSYPQAPLAEKALRELISMKSDVENGATLITVAKAMPLVRRS